MKYTVRIGAIIICAALVTASFAQNKNAQTLLWKISGNGLAKPSYLFGTMHLTDKRLFNFGDSVYHAIESTEGLAIEVNPDEMAAWIINKAFDELQSGKRIQDMLDAGDYNRDSSALAKKFKKPAWQVTTTDVYKEKNKWIGSYMQKGEMPTFVDAYLYGIAKKQGKWLGGIEDMADQAGLLDNMVDKGDVNDVLADDKTSDNQTLELMIKMYGNEDIAGIEKFNDASSQQYRDMVFINRNVKMARRIDSLAAFRTMFFAVGAAHLPGDSGVLNLLRARGFAVTPVISDRKIAADNYKFKEVALPWATFKEEKGMYTAKLPGNPTDVKLYGLVNMKFLYDITSNTCYYTTAFADVAYAGETDDSIYKKLGQAMFETHKPVPAKTVFTNGIEGREFSQEKDGYFVRTQTYIYNKAIYVAGLYSLKKDNVLSNTADTFFNGLGINKSFKAVTETQLFSDSIMGISFKTPVPVTYNKQISGAVAKDDKWKISAFTGSDMSTGSLIMLFSKEVTPGIFIFSDSVIYGQTTQLLNTQYEGVTINDTAINGLHVMQAWGHNKKQGVFLHMYSTILGNRNILLMVLGDSVALRQNQGLADVFNTFTFLNRQGAPWQTRTSANGGFTAWVPAPINFLPSLGSQRNQYVAYDTLTATSYVVAADTVSKYMWVDSDSVFWAVNVKKFTGDDSLIACTPITTTQAQGRELLMKSPSSLTILKRKRLLLAGNMFFEQAVYGTRQMLFSDDTNRFFSTLAVNSPVDTAFMHTPKTALLLQDIASADSATQSKAYQALEDAPFAKADLPLLHQAIFKKYNESDGSPADYINRKIAWKLEKIGDSLTVAFVSNSFNGFANKDTTNKLTALDILADTHTATSYQALAKIITSQTMPGKPNYSLLGALKDSLALTATIYPQLLAKASDTIWAPTVAGVALTLADSGIVDIKTAAAYEADFIKAAKQLLPWLKLSADAGDYQKNYLVDLLARFKTPTSLEVVKQFVDCKAKFMVTNTVKRLVENNLQVPPAVLLAMAKDPETRRDIYDILKDQKKQGLFPAQYLSQQYFAEASVYTAMADDDDDEDAGAITSIKFVGQKTGRYKGKSYVFYLYKVATGDTDSTTYLGVGGGYAPGSAGVDAKEPLSGIYWKENYNAQKLKEQFDAYLAGVEKRGDEEDGDGNGQ